MSHPAFRLQLVLDYREQIVELRQGELARLERDWQAQLAALEEARYRVQCELARIQDMQRSGRLDCADLAQQFGYLGQLRDVEQQARAHADELAGQVETKRGDLIKAMQDKQTLEKLKDRYRELQNREELRQESQTLDEIGVSRFLRESGEGESQ